MKKKMEAVQAQFIPLDCHLIKLASWPGGDVMAASSQPVIPS